MSINKNYVTITVALLFIFVTSNSQARSKDIIPDCVFGVKSISYVLYTRQDLSGRVVQYHDPVIPIRPGKPVAFFIHGFISQVNGTNYVDLIHTWLQKEDMNIFSVDWDKAACNGGISIVDYLAYSSAVKNVPVVGEDVAKFTQRLAQSFGVRLNQIIIIGHSLGAHVSGFAGKAIQRLANQKYKIIFGLDPAGPLYNSKGCSNRLCKSDAAYLLVFHTSEIKGFHQPLGDADFYFHGGTRQPGCTLSTSCDHARAVTYASLSIRRPHCFQGTKWILDSSNILNTRQCSPNSCAYAELGAARSNVHGTFYVNLGSKNSFCNA